MKKQTSMLAVLPVLFGFFVMGFCDIVGISSDYARETFGWSHTMAGFVPSMVFIWFLFFSIPVGIKMNAWGRKNTVMLQYGGHACGYAHSVVEDRLGLSCGVCLVGNRQHHPASVAQSFVEQCGDRPETVDQQSDRRAGCQGCFFVLRPVHHAFCRERAGRRRQGQLVSGFPRARCHYVSVRPLAVLHAHTS